MKTLHPAKAFALIEALKAGRRWADALKAGQIAKGEEAEALRIAREKRVL